MKDNPHYPEARMALYLLLRSAGVPDTQARDGAEVVLEQAAAFASAWLTATPTADRVEVRDHRGTRLAAENPDMHRAQVRDLGSK